MYESFYGLRAEPFRLSPDHRFCYNHSAYSKAMAYMAYALKRAEGFVMITGRPGTGKTTLISELVEDLADENITAANLVCTQLEADDLLKTVAYSFGVGSSDVDKAELLQRITVLLNRWHREKRRALLVVDEAQDLSVSAMEELRLLTNIQVGGQPLLQIFLLGQPELRDLIMSPQLEQVHQRIVAASHLEGLAADETEAYVVHRLHVVGWTGDPAIDRRIFPLIHKFSEGVPRRINLICSRLFLLGCVEERHEINVEDVRVVIAELQAESLAAGSAFSDEEFFLAGEPDWVPLPGSDEAPEPDAAAVPLRAVSNESFAPAALAGEAPASVETLAPVTPLKPPQPEPEPVAQEPVADRDETVPGQDAAPASAAPEQSAAGGAVDDDPAHAAAAPENEPVVPPQSPVAENAAVQPELPQRVVDPGERNAVARPQRSLGRPLLILGILVALGLSLLFFLELYVGRGDDWEAVSADGIVPAVPPEEIEAGAPIEELGILPSEQWEKDGELIDWERDVEQRDVGAGDAVVATGGVPVESALEDAAPGQPAPGERAPQESAPPAGETDAAVSETSAVEAVEETPAAAAQDIAGSPAASPVAPATAEAKTSAQELTAADSAQLLTLLNQEAIAATFSVTFGFDSIALSDEARDILAQATEKLLDEPDFQAEITGFADYQGDESYNLQLSIERARAVRDYFVEAGVARERLRVSGRGATSGQDEIGSSQPRELRVVQIELFDRAN